MPSRLMQRTQPETLILKNQLTIFLHSLLNSIRDLAPIVLVIAFFQLAVVQQPIPNLGGLLEGAVLVALGLTLFVRGLEMGLFPLGEAMAYAFARKGSLMWLLVFAFALGFGATVAEPALIAVTDEAARAAATSGVIRPGDEAQQAYALGLRIIVALAAGFALILGVIRIIKGWPAQYLVFGGYLGVMVVTPFSPPEIIGIAYDLGGVTASSIIVPLVTALGMGLASSIKGRNPIVDGFGVVAFVAIMPMIFVMLYGIVIQWNG